MALIHKGVNSINEIVIYADGGCRGNQNDTNIGGWGVVYNYNGKSKEIFGNAKNTTNNIMELTSAIAALKGLNKFDIPVRIIMDSQYVVEGMNKWVSGWIKNGWRNANKKSVANKDLWKELLTLQNQFIRVTFEKCEGHSNCEGNARADELANIAMDMVKDDD